MSKPQQPPVFQLPTTHGVVLKPQPPLRSFKPNPNPNPNPNSINNLPPPIVNNLPPPIVNNLPPPIVSINTPPLSPHVNSTNNLPPPSPKMISKLSPSISPSGSPPVPRRAPPTPNQNPSGSPPIVTTTANSNNNLPPPPPITITANLPPPIASLNNMPPPPPPPQIGLSHSGGMPPPPQSMLNKSLSPPQSSPSSTPTTPKRFSTINQFKPAANTTPSAGVPPAITMLGSPLSSVPSLKSLQQPPSFTKSNSLDPKTMSSYTQQQQQQQQNNNSNNNNSNYHNTSSPSLSPLSHSGSISPPLLTSPLSPSMQEKRNSIGGSINIGGGIKMGNGSNRLSQDLNSMFQNRLTNGLSPPVSTPFYDEKLLSSQKAAELKEKRDIDEKERRDREKSKKEKDEQDKKDKKGKKEKDELEKKEKKKEEAEKKKKEEQEKKDKDKKKKDDEKKTKNTKLKGSGNVGPPPSIFNSSLESIMEVQKERFSDYQDLPYPAFLKIITDGIIQCNGCSTEGIFRVPGTTSEVNRIKKQINEFDFNLNTDDPHVLAGLLKLWLRELTDPVIPTEIYYDCIRSKSKEDVTRQVQQLPSINREVLIFILNFLKYVANPANTPRTKMDADNIAMVFAPGLLRCPPSDPNMLLNTQFEKDFIKNLIDFIV